MASGNVPHASLPSAERFTFRETEIDTGRYFAAQEARRTVNPFNFAKRFRLGRAEYQASAAHQVYEGASGIRKLTSYPTAVGAEIAAIPKPGVTPPIASGSVKEGLISAARSGLNRKMGGMGFALVAGSLIGTGTHVAAQFEKDGGWSKDVTGEAVGGAGSLVGGWMGWKTGSTLMRATEHPIRIPVVRNAAGLAVMLGLSLGASLAGETAGDIIGTATHDLFA